MTKADNQREYSAFISYSHRDDDWGAWLHKALETYRAPQKLVGKNNRDGSVPKRLSPVFQDIHELPTASDLGAVITNALAHSRYLIVICSPAAAQSQWVNEEILSFKRLGKANRILAIVVDGEPNASDQASGQEQECFPPALRYNIDANGQLSDQRAEPIAADARPGKGGKSNAKLKLIAGLLGVNFDDLVEREKKRQRQRYAALAVFSLLGVIAAVTVWLSFDAEQQRSRQAEIAKLTSAAVEDLDNGAVWSALEKLALALPEDSAEADKLWPARSKAVLNRAIAAQRVRLKVALDALPVGLRQLQNGQLLIQFNSGHVQLFNSEGKVLRKFASTQTGRDISTADYYVTDDESRLILAEISVDEIKEPGEFGSTIYVPVFRSKTYDLDNGNLLHDVTQSLAAWESADQLSYAMPVGGRFNVDGRQFMTSAQPNWRTTPDQQQLLWVDTETGEVSKGLTVEGPIASINYVSGLGTIFEQNLPLKGSSKNYLKSLQLARTDDPNSVTLWPADKPRACAAGADVALADVQDRRLANAVYAASKDRQTIYFLVPDISGWEDYCVTGWNTATGEQIPLFELGDREFGDTGINGNAPFSPDEKRVIKELLTLDPPLLTLRGSGVKSIIDARISAQSDDAETSATADWNDQEIVINSRQMPSYSANIHRGAITGLAIDETAGLLYSTAKDKTLKAWALGSGFKHVSLGTAGLQDFETDNNRVLSEQYKYIEDNAAEEYSFRVVSVGESTEDQEKAASQPIKLGRSKDEDTRLISGLLADARRVGVSRNRNQHFRVHVEGAPGNGSEPSSPSRFYLFDSDTAELLADVQHDHSGFYFPVSLSGLAWLSQANQLLSVNLESGITRAAVLPDGQALEGIFQLGDQLLLTADNGAKEPDDRIYRIYLFNPATGTFSAAIREQAAQAISIIQNSLKQRAVVQWDFGYRTDDAETGDKLHLVEEDGSSRPLMLNADIEVYGDYLLSDSDDLLYKFEDGVGVYAYSLDGKSEKLNHSTTNWFEPLITPAAYAVDDDSLLFIGTGEQQPCDRALSTSGDYRFSSNGQYLAVSDSTENRIEIYDVTLCVLVRVIENSPYVRKMQITNSGKLWLAIREFASEFVSEVQTVEPFPNNLQLLELWQQRGWLGAQAVEQ